MTQHNLHPDDFGNGIGGFLVGVLTGIVIAVSCALCLALLSGCIKPIEGLNL